MARRGSDGLGKLYLWGCNHCGQIGDGTKYVIDMTICYAWVNGINTVYTSALTPAVGDNTFSDISKATVVGSISAASASSITVNEINYIRTAASDIYPYKVGQVFPKELALEDGTVYEDWEAYDTGWYHAVALRHDASGKSEVYVWGSNEYGQLGNGNYCNESLISSTLPEGVNNTVELIAWPHKLTTAEFPYTDVKAVKATHYGTFLVRENGETYFAGCNKRNQLGIGNVSSDTTFIPTFTKLGALFSTGEVFAERVQEWKAMYDTLGIAYDARTEDIEAAELAHFTDAQERSDFHDRFMGKRVDVMVNYQAAERAYVGVMDEDYDPVDDFNTWTDLPTLIKWLPGNYEAADVPVRKEEEIVASDDREAEINAELIAESTFTEEPETPVEEEPVEETPAEDPIQDDPTTPVEESTTPAE